MKLNRRNLNNKDFFNNNNISMPNYDLDKLYENTEKTPRWIHFGAGNIFRVFVANALDKAIEEDRCDTGIIIAESFDYEIIDKVFKETDNLSLSVIMNSNGRLDYKIIGSVVESVKTDEEGILKLIKAFENESLQMISFTITEKGYVIKDVNGEYIQSITDDFKNGITKGTHIISIVVNLIYRRFKSCKKPIALVSMDNCSHNGDKLKEAVVDIADKWVKFNFVEKEFIKYIEDNISFPLSMIDKITPRPDNNISNILMSKGFNDMNIIKTSKNTYTSHFVNAESAEYLIIENDFPNGKPNFENEKVIFTTRDVVNNVETMKVTTCLNPLHTALAVTGVLLNKETITDTMNDKLLRGLVELIGYSEGLKVVVNPKIIDPEKFIYEVINERFSNYYVKDVPERIATDTSQKIGIRFGNTIKSYIDSDELSTNDLIGIPLAIACWIRYLIGLDDEGNKFIPSTDPLLEELSIILKGVTIGSKDIKLDKILSKKDIFGLDLTTIELGKRIENYFNEMIYEVGAVRKTLEKYVEGK